MNKSIENFYMTVGSIVVTLFVAGIVSDGVIKVMDKFEDHKLRRSKMREEEA